MQDKRAPAGETPLSGDEAVVKLLEVLGESGALPQEELWRKSALDISTFATALKTARDGGWIKDEGPEDDPRFAVTPIGARIARVAGSSPP
jgi:hypothetical protein